MIGMSFLLYADSVENAIILNHKGGIHSNIPAPADEPDAFYNTNTQTVIIDGDGYVNYYNVEITPVTTWIVAISTQVNGYYDTIDVSSLSDGVYCITIYSPTGNIFEGFFEIE